jgi:heme exporter protein C
VTEHLTEGPPSEGQQETGPTRAAATSAPVTPAGTDGAETGPVGTGSGGTRVLGALTLAAVGLLFFLAFIASPPDARMGENVRLIYVHVPVVTAAYLGILATTIGSVMFLWKRSQWWDLVAASAAEVSALFTALTLVTGMIWGRPTWGVYWVWDARLTSTAMLFLLLLGYLAVRRTAVDTVIRGKRAAIVGLLLLPNMIIVNRSVEWWRSLHQEPTLFRLNPTIADLQLFTLVFGIVTALLVFAWLVIHRFRLGYLQDQLDRQDLVHAIDERRAEVAR